jgi:hypothetical protein
VRLLEIDLQVQPSRGGRPLKDLLHRGGDDLTGRVAMLVARGMHVIEADALWVQRDVLHPEKVGLKAGTGEDGGGVRRAGR